MIYISSASAKKTIISQSIQFLADNGFTSIELSGGTRYYPGYIEDLKKLQKAYKLKYIFHNYFPPPIEDFVLNLASLNNNTYLKSYEHIRQALLLSQDFHIDKYGFHAGFLLDIDLKEIGRQINYKPTFNTEKSIERFCEAFNQLKTLTNSVALYLENNVFSHKNAVEFRGKNPFMLTDYDSYLALKKKIDFRLLLDIAHLKVSVNSLNLDFESQLEKMMNETDYIHVSENDGLEDENRFFSRNSKLLNRLKGFDLKGKNITLEIYGDINSIKASYELMNELI